MPSENAATTDAIRVAPVGPATGPAGGWPDDFAHAEPDRRAAVRLLHLRGIVPRDLLALAHRTGTARSAETAILGGRAGSTRDRDFLSDVDDARIAAAIAACGARLVLYPEPEYPDGLRALDDPPLGLFVRGAPLDGLRPAVAVVGSRKATAYGIEVARSLGRGLGGAGVTVISGAARGIDAAAHVGALDAGGSTVAVLGCGIDRDYPASSRGLLARIAREGSVVSEYPPGVPAEPFRFPARNRIVAAMARAVVVVEGAPGSGSLITVEHAQACGRDVYAVPGAVTAPLSASPNELIRSGAPLVRDALDVLSELGLGSGGAAAAPPDLPPGPAAVLAALGGVPEGPDALAARAGLDLPDTLMALLDLEMRGLVRRTGGRFERTLRAGR